VCTSPTSAALVFPRRFTATGGAAAAAPSTVEVDKTNFQKEVVQSHVPVLLDCYAEYADARLSSATSFPSAAPLIA
jgi:hypothetical protein